jgi:hypothetical protein
METLIINIPERKSAIVKQLLKELGVTMQKATQTKRKPSDFLGTISKEKAQEMLLYVDNSRQEWERNI